MGHSEEKTLKNLFSGEAVTHPSVLGAAVINLCEVKAWFALSSRWWLIWLGF